uniref:Uncharacterized protein n=1 Tax=Panagrellus redivivus TaxID=6233 RepID=A0A7E4URW8_PANRE
MGARWRLGRRKGLGWRVRDYAAGTILNMASPLFPDPSAWKAKLSVEDAIWAEACASTVSAFSPKNSFSNQPYQHKDANEAGFLR